MKWNIRLPLLLAFLATRTARSQEGGYHEDYQPSPYHYEYKVHDPKEYLDFGAEEEGDGKGDVHGQYHVQLPDGRLQHVSYHVDDYNGYIADVSYDGHAEHPSYHGGHHGVSHGGHHGVSHGGVGGGHRFGKALIQDSGVSPQVVSKSNEVSRSREGKKISEPSSFPKSSGISSNDLSGSFGRFDNQGIKPTNSFFNTQPNIVQPVPVKKIEISEDFSHRFGEPSTGRDFSGNFGTASNRGFSQRFGEPSTGNFAKESNGDFSQRFGETSPDKGLSGKFATTSNGDFSQRFGEPSTGKDLSGNFGSPFNGDFSQRFGEPSPAKGLSGKFATTSNGDFSQRFGEPSTGKDLSANIGKTTNEGRKLSNSLISRRPIQPEQSPIIADKSSKPFQTRLEKPSQPFTTFGNIQNRHDNSFFSDRQVQQHPEAASILPPSNILKETSSRHGKSGRQDFDENSTNLFGSSSHSKPTVHSSPAVGNTVTKSKQTFESKFGEPKTNSFFGSVEKSQERPRNFDSSHDRPRDFDSFSPIFGTGSANKGSSKKPVKSFDTFSPIFGQQSKSKEFSGKIKTINKKPVTDDTDFFKPSGPVRPLESIKSNTRPTSSSFPSRTNTFNNREGKPSFPIRQPVAPPTQFTKQPLTNKKVIQDKSQQPAPRFKPRPIGFGNNHPVLQSLKDHKQNTLRSSNVRQGSVDSQAGFGGQGSFRQRGNRQQFGRALGEESLSKESPKEQKSQVLESKTQGQRAFITHKAIPV